MALDRLVASAAAMAAVFYLMAGALAWYRLCRPKPASSSRVRSVILDRALAWSSLAVIFYTVAAIKMGWHHWSDEVIDAIRIIALATIFVCGLVSVRAMTEKHFGYSAVGWFGIVSFVSGLIMLFL